jgi:hypothetical protein
MEREGQGPRQREEEHEFVPPWSRGRSSTGEEQYEVVSAVGAWAEQEAVSAAGRRKRNSRQWSTTVLLLPDGSRSSASPRGSGSLC